MSKATVIGTIRALRNAGQVHRRRGRLPRQVQPDTLRLDYARELVAVSVFCRDVVEEETAGLARLFRTERSDVRLDAATDINEAIDRAAKRIAARLRQRELEDVAEKIGRRTSEFQKVQLARQAKAAIGIDVTSLMPGVDAVIQGFVVDNVALIKSIPSAYLSDVEKTLTRDFRSGERWETTAEHLQERFGVSESKARLIARDQVGKLNGQLNEERQKGLGVTGYIWRTVNDGRVRDEHEAREGVSYEWSNPPEDGHPGEPVNCRCSAEPDFGPIFASLRE